MHAVQVELIRQGRVDDITQETRLFDEGRQETYPMRSKEGLADYRYFPEPDLPAITVTEAFIAAAQVRPAPVGHLPAPFCTGLLGLDTAW